MRSQGKGYAPLTNGQEGVTRTRAPRLKLERGVGSNKNGAELSSSKSWFDDWFNDGSVTQRRMRLAGAEHVTRPFEENVWVYRAVRSFSQSLASVPRILWDRDPSKDEGAQPVPESHPLHQVLLISPNSVQSPRQLREAGAVHSMIDGEDIWFLADQEGQPIAAENAAFIDVPTTIIQVRGAAISRIETDAFGLPAWYVYKSSSELAQEVRFPASSVLHFREYDPNNPLRGLGSVEAALREIEGDFQAQRYQEGVLRNSGSIGGIISRESKKAPDVVAAEQDELNDYLENKKNTGKFRILEGKGIKVEHINAGPKEMEFRDLRMFMRDSILSALNVPKPVVGLFEEATFNNMRTALQHFWTSVTSQIERDDDVINCKLIARLRNPQDRRMYYQYDRSAITALQEDMTDQIRLAGELASKDIGLSMRESLTVTGVDVDTEDMPHVDEHFMSVGKTTAERVLEEPEPEPEPEEPTEPPVPIEEAIRSMVDDALYGVRSIDKEDRNPDVPEGVFERPGFDDRRSWYAKMHAPFLDKGEGELQPLVQEWLEEYLRAQKARWNDFANSGSSARGFEGVDTKTVYTRSKNLNEDDIEKLLLDQKEWERRLIEKVGRTIDSIYQRAAEEMARELDGHIFGGMQQRHIVDYLTRQKINLAEGVTSTLAKQVRKILLDTFGTITSTGTIQELVQEALPELTGSLSQAFSNTAQRALTIARTETGHAANGARMNEMRAAGVEQVEWVTSGDVFVRGNPSGPYSDATYSHYILDGEVRDLGEEFDHNLRFPHDPQAPAGAVINCRCTMRPTLTDE